MSKKIGILTYHFSDNYGAVMQAYGTVSYLKSLGYDVEVVNYVPDYVDHGAKLFWPTSKENLRKNAVFFYQKIINFIDGFTGKERRIKFAQFRKEHLNVTGDVALKTITELENANLGYDALIAGSDQIWNPGVLGEPDPAYYLAFNSQARKKLTYAASYGTASPQFNDSTKLYNLISGLDAIGVRELSAVDLVKEFGDAEANHVPDPTFLVDNFNEILAAPLLEDNYLFSYVLRSGENVKSIEKCIAETKSLKIIRPKNYQRPWLNDKFSVDVGPKEWLSGIANASFVLSNSFHGIALSILLNKPFTVVPLPGAKSALNERALSLLTKVGLEDRILSDASNDQVNIMVSKSIDWKSVNEKIKDFRLIGREFLTKELINA